MGVVLPFRARPKLPKAPKPEQQSVRILNGDSPEGELVQQIAAEETKPARSNPRSGRMAFWMKTVQALLLAVAVCFSLGATTDAGSRMDNMSHRLMCQCGCAQLLGECDHVGCPSREKELADLNTDIASGASDQQIMDSFAAKYGDIVLAAPRTHGFDLVAWIAPFAVFLAALLGTILLICRWGGLRGFKPQPTAANGSAALTEEERARREKIRRETESGGER
jgi:cytochrome c-type biogenesis protein CcmH/NrfF